MSRQRRNFSAKFKSDLVIELLKGEKDLNTLAKMCIRDSYNIFQEVKRKNIGDIVFLPSDDNKKIKQVNFYRKIVKHFPRWLNAVQIAYRRKRDYQKMIDSPEVYNIDFSDYDAIHFHSTIALFKYRRNLECYEGKIILTTWKLELQCTV